MVNEKDNEEELLPNENGDYVLDESADLEGAVSADIDKLVDEIGEEGEPENAVDFKKKGLAYDDDCPMPGEETDFLSAYSDGLDVEAMKRAGAQSLIANVAINKLKREEAAFRSLEDKEKLRKYIVSTTIRDEENQYFQKYGFELSGQQKRTLRKKVERAFQKNYPKMTAKQKQDILDYLNMPSQTESSDRDKAYKSGSVASMAKQVEDLMKGKL